MEKIPRHFSKEARALFKSIAADFDLGPAELKILRVSLEAFDRAQASRRQIDEEGMTLADRFGQHKIHPLINVERDARSAFLVGLRQLNLQYDDDPPARNPGRPTDFERER
jgi:phage terminase small subunit